MEFFCYPINTNLSTLTNKSQFVFFNPIECYLLNNVESVQTMTFDWISKETGLGFIS